MPWNATSPDGTKSVKANRPFMQENTTYIQTTMGNSVVGTNTAATRDHFWNVGSNEDGRHRFVQSPAFTVGGNPTDPVLGTGMDGVLYLKTISSRVQGFYRNTNGIYQYIPAFLSGTVNITSTSTYVTIAAIPASSYGEIYIWKDDELTHGTFVSDATKVYGFSTLSKVEGQATNYFVELLNDTGSVVDLNLKGRRGDGSSGVYTYRITYRAI